jgi:hypothetical protein
MSPAGRPRQYPPEIGKHLATLNLFREADGSVHITVAEAKGARLETTCDEYPRPIDYVDTLVIEAAKNLHPRDKAE